MTSLQEARRERDEAVARMTAEDEATSDRENLGGCGGIVENITEGAKSLVGAVTGATKEKAQEASDKASETKDAAMEKAGETKEKMEDIKERARKVKDRSTGKVMDYEDTSEPKGSTSEKLEEYKESAGDAARKVRDFLVEGKEEARVKLAGETKDRLGETRESARKQLEDLKQRAAEKAVVDRKRKLKEADEKDKARSASENIYGSFPTSMSESFKEKMTLPKDIVAAHKRREHDDDDKMRERIERETENEEEDDVILRVKEADQMSGTWFPDPGKMGGEGTGPTGVHRKDKH